MKLRPALAALLAATVLAVAAPAYEDVLIGDVPHVRQKPDFCGEACAEMFLRKLGHAIDQDEVFDRSGLDPELGRGCYTRDLATALQATGFQIGDVWGQVAAADAAAGLESHWQALHADLCRGVPSIVCMRYRDTPDATEHFRLILGYAAARDEVIFHEPAEADGAYRRLARSLFLGLWPLKTSATQWTVVRLRLDPGTIRPAVTAEGLRNADYAQRVRALREKLKGQAFTVVVERPFVVVGDESPAMVRHRAETTVRWAVRLLKQDFFAKDPAGLLDIWLFRDKASYRTHTKALFDDDPDTPFGYYSAQHQALIMNIDTGGGTLVHEIVHPFMRANYPHCPDWLNEGLGSLYEQSEERQGHIRGRTNWRLPKLQEAIRNGAVPSFADLTGASGKAFYADDPGTNYAQARYLCYYLQEKGLLTRFFHQAVASQEADPSGYAALRKVLGEDDMSAFQKSWETFVTGLVYPP